MHARNPEDIYFIIENLTLLFTLLDCHYNDKKAIPLKLICKQWDYTT